MEGGTACLGKNGKNHFPSGLATLNKKCVSEATGQKLWMKHLLHINPSIVGTNWCPVALV